VALNDGDLMVQAMGERRARVMLAHHEEHEEDLPVILAATFSSVWLYLTEHGPTGEALAENWRSWSTADHEGYIPVMSVVTVKKCVDPPERQMLTLFSYVTGGIDSTAI
jgi:hypothetical protein